jgi:hypothetical protein
MIHELDNSTLSEEEYRLRRVVNSLSMYHEATGQVYEVEVSNENKYGIDDFSQFDDLYSFTSVEDMAIVINNSDFQEDFYDQYNYSLGIDAYYLLSSTISQNYDIEMVTVSLIIWDNDYNLCISGTELIDKTFLMWNVIDTCYSIDVKELAKFYAGVDGLYMNSEIPENGSTIYYLFSENGGVLFEDMGLQTVNPATAYLWEQDDVIGVLLVQGEHKAENFDLCVLERHEL